MCKTPKFESACFLEISPSAAHSFFVQFPAAEFSAHCSLTYRSSHDGPPNIQCTSIILDDRNNRCVSCLYILRFCMSSQGTSWFGVFFHFPCANSHALAGAVLSKCSFACDVLNFFFTTPPSSSPSSCIIALL